MTVSFDVAFTKLLQARVARRIAAALRIGGNPNNLNISHMIESETACIMTRVERLLADMAEEDLSQVGTGDQTYMVIDRNGKSHTIHAASQLDAYRVLKELGIDRRMLVDA